MGAWTAAIEAGLDAALLAPAMIDAQMRQGRYEEAMAAAAQRGPGDADLTRRLAAATLAAGRAPAAIETLDRHLEMMPADRDAQWLRLHALFAIAASGQGDPAAASARQRFKSLAPPYVDAKAAHSALAAEWLAALP
jgi:hypothetical protein